MIGLSYGNFQAATTTPFTFGNALKFDGVNDFILSDTVTYSAINSVYTKFKFNSTGTFQVFFRYGGGEVLNDVRVTAANQLQTFSRAAGPTSFAYTLVDGVEYTLVSTFNNTTGQYKIVINGETFTSIRSTTAGVDYNVYIGQNGGNPNGYPDILMRGFVIADSEIDYNNAIAGDFTGLNFLLYYDFNQPSGTAIILDESGNNVNGTLKNFDTATCWIPY